MKTGVFPVSVIWKAPDGVVQYETVLVTGFVSSRGLFGVHRSWVSADCPPSKYWTVSVLDCGLAIKRAMPSQKVAKYYAEALDSAYGHLDTEELQDCKKEMDELYYAIVRKVRG